MTPPAGKPRQSRARRPSQSKKSTPPAETPPGDRPSSSVSSPSPLGLTGEAFVRPKQAPPAASASDLDRPEYEPPKPPPLEWTPERLSPVLRGAGHLIHTIDPVADGPRGADLWKLTKDDAEEIAEPLARIMNRYATLRGAAGFSDEISVAATVAPYVKKNLAERGRIKSALEHEEQTGAHASRYQPEQARQPDSPVAERRSEPERQPEGQPDGQPEVRLAPPAGEDEPDPAGMNPKAGVADAFAFALPTAEVSQPAYIVVEPPQE